MAKAFTLEEVREFFKSEGCLLLTDKYQNRSTPLRYKCACGNKSVVKLSLFFTGTRCVDCQKENKSKAQRFSYAYVKSDFEEKGCELHSEIYKNTSQKLSYKCECGNNSVITYRKFRQGQRCFKCSGTPKLTIRQVKEKFKEHGLELIGKNYVNGKIKLKCLCRCGNETECSVNNLRRFGGCEQCQREKIPTSKQQNYICELVSGELNYQVDRIYLDVAFPEICVYVECDFSGHWVAVDYGKETLESFNSREGRRRGFLNSEGWREVRLTSKKDILYDDESMRDVLKKAVTIAGMMETDLIISTSDDDVREIVSGDLIMKIDYKRKWVL